ncbi:MAG: 4-hydroxy-tetrahydrodipicolinate reductase [Betaproteobacteria bacterium]|nr:4-hydroxy-tetrahydrodipicolinate reductase [Betaproteobacteria bacterium]MDE2211435.1 4-hydroxy-tetrahydrodipicolinate reductase [Betaproteobacteria bacterium]MDE2623990.1 4-hydroxy-tetrahydrodipicolinate reductase [Betaproteobacteria bacterium]
MMALGICIAGSSGRMGRALMEAVVAADDLRLTGALEQPGSPYIGRNPGDWLGTPVPAVITDNVPAALEASRVLIDFTRPAGTLGHLQACLALGRGIVIGTTGFSDAERETIRTASTRIPVVFAPNMSMGVTLSLALIDLAARVLQPGFDVEIVEAHHRHKVDAPSGTALRMGEVVAAARGRRLSEVAVYGREGITGERNPDTIGFATVRGGDVVGDHTVSFMADGERLEISHRASSRTTFALGALRAARFIADKPSGLFDMRDVLGLDALLPGKRV